MRASLAPGDFVVFFCGKQVSNGKWDYFYVGVGSVGELLDRHQIWSENDYEPYRHFFNILARPADGRLQQHEVIHRFHPDWAKRAAAPYIVFDPETSVLDLQSPLQVASDHRAQHDIEVWRQDDDRVGQLSDLLLPPPPTRRGRRSTHPQRPHSKMNLARQAECAAGFEELRA